MASGDTSPTPGTSAEDPGTNKALDRQHLLNSQLLEALDRTCDAEAVKNFLKSGANPNATCRMSLISACHKAALYDEGVLVTLLEAGAWRSRFDKHGHTPLHFAACVGLQGHISKLLDLSQGENDNSSTSSGSEDHESNTKVKALVDAQCHPYEELVDLPLGWSDGITHDCKEVTVPLFQPGWTALHVASAFAKIQFIQELVSFGADVNIPDAAGRTPLDVIGYAAYYQRHVSEKGLIDVIEYLLSIGGVFNTMRGGVDNLDAPVHTAVYLESLEFFRTLLRSNISLSCLSQSGDTPLHVCVKRELEEFLQLTTEDSPVDVKDTEGRTVLRAAVDASWLPGVRITLAVNADVTCKANDGETPIHAAASIDNLGVLKEILKYAKHRQQLDCKNEKNETPLLKATASGHADNVELLLKEGADVKITLPGDVNVLHIAADNDNTQTLKVLLANDNAKTLINNLTEADISRELYGFAPIHMAVTNNHVECADILISNGADYKLKCTGLDNSPAPIHIAAVINRVDMAETILKHDKMTLTMVDGSGRLALHAASKQSSRDMITFLLKQGGDLSAYTQEPKESRRTAIDIIINNISKPTEFIEDIFDSYISSDGKDLQERNCRVKVDYSILMPIGRETEQLKVIKALLKTGNRFNQERLLKHPLVESFLYLKWKALLPFFYAIICIQSLFLMSLTILIGSTFYYLDTKECPPSVFDQGVWCLFTVLFFGLKFCQDYHISENHRFKRAVRSSEAWIKLGSVIFASLTLLIIPWSPHSIWTRHISTIALLLTWLDMLFLISRFPNWGYYILMFGKVATKVIKILFTFLFLVLGFSLSFMILLRSKIPFDGPWPAVVKTIVMMTSEFDYGNLFDDGHTEELADSLIILRIIFLVFLLIAAIALMNLLTGVAVNDIGELELFGNIKRLTKQVAFIGTFDSLVYSKAFELLPVKLQEILNSKRLVSSELKLRPRKYRPSKTDKLPPDLQDAIYNIAQRELKETEDEKEQQSFKKMLNDIQTIIDKKKDRESDGSSIASTSRDKEGVTTLADLEKVVRNIEAQTKAYIDLSQASMKALNTKVDLWSEGLMKLMSAIQNSVQADE